MIKRSSMRIFSIILWGILLASYPVFKEKSKVLENKLSNPLTTTSPNKAKLIQTYEKTPLNFEENNGQTDPQVKYLSRGNGYNLFLAANKDTFSSGNGCSRSKT
jgi:hypothetical protein